MITVWVEKGQCNKHRVVKLLDGVSHSDLESRLPVNCGTSCTEHHSTTQDGVYFCGRNLRQEPLAGLSAFARMHPQLHILSFSLPASLSHHGYEDTFEEVHRVRQSKCSPNGFEMQQPPHLSQ